MQIEKHWNYIFSTKLALKKDIILVQPKPIQKTSVRTFQRSLCFRPLPRNAFCFENKKRRKRGIKTSIDPGYTSSLRTRWSSTKSIESQLCDSCTTAEKIEVYTRRAATERSRSLSTMERRKARCVYTFHVLALFSSRSLSLSLFSSSFYTIPYSRSITRNTERPRKLERRVFVSTQWHTR